MSPFNVRVLECGELGWPKEMSRLGVDPAGIAAMASRGVYRIVKLEQVGRVVADVIKQEMISQGGEALVAPRGYFGEPEMTDVILMGTLWQHEKLVAALRNHPPGILPAIATEVKEALDRYGSESPGTMQIGSRSFVWGRRTYVMGIINVTPDSFSGDGLAGQVDAAVDQAVRFVEEGADILDIGGESTRPGSEPVSADEELRRVMPLLERLAGRVDVPISIDTYKAQVARQALAAGAALVNDVWGLRMDPQMAAVVAEHKAPVVIMHNRSRPKNAVQEERLGGHYVGIEYTDLMADIIRELRHSIDVALKAGIEWDKVIVDPGIGFGKTVKQNLEIIRRLGELKVLGRPILLGPSRKSFIGYTLELPPQERQAGTAAAVALGIAKGADIVRVHDVRDMARVARMADAIVRGGGRTPGT